MDRVRVVGGRQGRGEKVGITVPFDQRRQVIHIVGRHCFLHFAGDPGYQLFLAGDKLNRGMINVGLRFDL
jgi:hypothetical protein